MKAISVFFLVVALVLALLFGAQTASWSWGPALLGLGAAALFGIFGSRLRCHLPLALALLAAAGWIILRCYQSEVVDGARADALLVVALLSSCWIVAGFGGHKKALTLLHDGIALTVIANGVVAFFQWRDPSFCWPYEARPREQLSGFFGHYNYFSNYLLGTSGILLGRAVFGSDVKWRRLSYLIVVLGAFSLIPLSGSRGGVLALGVGLLVFSTALALILYRRKNRWFPLAAAIVPFGLVAGGGVAWIVLNGIQADRQQEEGIANLADGGSRLEWIGLALATSRDHLWQGGGSRSYSWERNHKWDPEEFGWAHENEPFVHNELLQAITDYGVIGAALVVMVLGLAIWRCLASLVLGISDGKSDALDEGDADAIHAGVLTAGAAMVTQANLSFVFHFMPLVMLFGMLLGLILPRRAKASSPGFMSYPPGLALGLVLLWAGSKGTHTLERLWPVIYVVADSERMAPEEALARFEAAGNAWPGFEIAEESGKLFLMLATREGVTEEASAKLRQESILAYQEAARENPFSPRISVNLGNALSVAGRYDEAEAELQRTIELQGFLEPVFRGRFHLAQAIHREWYFRWMQERRAGEALHEFLRARDLVSQSHALHHPYFWQQECLPFQNDLNQTIEFLENARVQPEPPQD